MTQPPRKDMEQERLAQALRENLKRRKEQQRSRAAAAKADPKSPLEESAGSD